MIMNFRHKGLRDLFLHGQTSGVMTQHVRRLRHRLAVIDAACRISDIDMPGYRLHQLSGERDGVWAISVSGNWRITFEFINGDAYILNYEDYH
ncbi:type II toxin-antitoxin system RelE/ParE family toxin [Citrobacter rodentium]|jgi:Plasmid maintenance system killer protein|uniref:Plasmid maintenance protein n=2 Tax=Citrobacter rodentium TaxID=67825 RepID=D2TJA7_CITRI|nr:type II toxin-antitoxin system RelE/ParE family toxin [Citrobacter rodentium]KIQ51336.1 Killer protein [Citrobacter rodentium]QBY28145.1 Killer protein [Citrobacter rodentium]UHO29976.1 type II toxin-antitoxin system RelE/ParE family toxin [Citrobacter rodentium NBRC 105723 = DSM 16636]CBG88321.1 putative plasmid maintenance protein [Citrobacter rodentium ICC168]HAT8011522.1 Killer protein [Citrobacter rodentium NBRC 105723 = DSM 16636]